MKKRLALVLALVLGLTGCFYDPASPVNKDKLAQLNIFARDSIDRILVDIRPREAYAKGHRPNAINIPVLDLRKGTFDLEGYEDCLVILYGNFEREAEEAAEYLREVGDFDVEVSLGLKEGSYGLVEFKTILGRDFAQALRDNAFLKESYIIDTRPAEDYSAGHAPGAINITGQEFADKLDEVPRNRPIYVYGLDSENDFASVLAGYRDDVTHVLEGTSQYDYAFQELEGEFD